MPQAGSIIRALDFTESESDDQTTDGTTTSTSYTATLTGGTACGVTVMAPTSGVIVIHNECELDNSGSNDSFCGWVVREGATIGSGSIHTPASDNRALRHNGTAAERYASSYRLSGLEPGTAYNVQQVFRVSGGTGTFARKHLAVVPVP